jgi:hypothetical protein
MLPFFPLHEYSVVFRFILLPWTRFVKWVFRGKNGGVVQIHRWAALGCDAAAPGMLALVLGTGHRWMGFILGDAWLDGIHHTSPPIGYDAVSCAPHGLVL